MEGKGSSTLGLSWNDVNVVKINRGVFFYFQEYDVTFLLGGKGGGTYSCGLNVWHDEVTQLLDMMTLNSKLVV